ncbi:MauE/DoxX family redox-associated membrane protein [Pseudocolwellia sp. HL-MZ19]|uniref:MauE/DoxX family redox-associated membrane protein n=1 Tax=Pseudocolwellia sp. HL-MZ19 TaxID=3400846 RepID=UPI003CF3FA02
MSYLSFISDITAVFLLWLFANAGIHKLLPDNKRYFIELLNEYGISSKRLSIFFLYALGLSEMLIAIGIIFQLTRNIAVVAAIIVLLGYLLVMAFQLYKGKVDISCGCAGPNANTKISTSLLWRNGLLSLLALFCLTPSVGLSGTFWIVTVLSSLMMIILYSSIEKLIENAQLIELLRNK